MNAGHQQTRKLRIVVFATLDGFAPTAKPLLIRDVLSERGHTVIVTDTSNLSRASDKNPGRLLPSGHPTELLLFLAGVVARILEKLPGRIVGILNATVCICQLRLRGRLLARMAKRLQADVVVCEGQMDSGLMLLDLGPVKKFYNCATPLAEELYFGGKLGRKGYDRLRAFETSIYAASDYLSFHWYSYADYVRKYYNYDGKNIFVFDRNATVMQRKATYSSQPRIVYLGYLSGYWIDLDLLSKLTKIYPRIDVYGLPRPSRKYRLNYKGYASPEVLSDYQFGLITCTKDRLRREGFSAKHVDYLAAGLPVLAPEWRTSTQGLKGTISYSVENFIDQLKEFSDVESWSELSKQAREQASAYTAKQVAAEFIGLIEETS